MGLSTTVRMIVNATLEGSADLSTPVDKLAYTFNDTLADGTGADQADEIWHDTRDMNAGVDDDLDLAGSLTNGLGETVTFAKIKGIFIINKETDAGEDLKVGGGDDDAGGNAFDTWTDEAGGAVDEGINQVIIPPGGMFALYTPAAAGFGVTGGTGDILRVHNDGAANITYDIILIGTTA